MAEAKEEGPGPRARVSGGREGRSKGRGQGAGSGREGAGAGHRRAAPAAGMQRARRRGSRRCPGPCEAVPGGRQPPPRRRAAGPGVRGPLQPGDRRPPAGGSQLPACCRPASGAGPAASQPRCLARLL